MNAIVKNIPNGITCLNLVAGVMAVICAFGGRDALWGLDGFAWAWIFIGIAAVADFLDGFAARTLHTYSSLGKELDSLCDLVSFGVAPAMIMFNCMEAVGSPEWVRWLVPLIPVAGALRLARFNIDTTQQEEFCGLPVPANALFCVSLGVLAAEGEWALSKVALLAVACVMSWLLVSPVRMFSLKFHGFGWRGNELRYLYLLAAALLLAAWRLRALPAVVLLYVAVSCVRWLILRARGGRGISE